MGRGSEMLRTPAKSTFVDQTLTHAIEEYGELMEQLKDLFNEADLNFEKIDELGPELCDCVGRIGSHKLIGATQKLCHLIGLNNKERSIAKFSEVSELYGSLQSKFETIIERWHADEHTVHWILRSNANAYRDVLKIFWEQ